MTSAASSDRAPTLDRHVSTAAGQDGEKTTSPEADTPESEEVADEYPHGMRLAMIVIALVLTMFIVSQCNQCLSAQSWDWVRWPITSKQWNLTRGAGCSRHG